MENKIDWSKVIQGKYHYQNGGFSKHLQAITVAVNREDVISECNRIDVELTDDQIDATLEKIAERMGFDVWIIEECINDVLNEEE